MKLSNLMQGINYEIKGKEENIQSLQKRSQDKVTNGIYFCYQGVNTDGKKYVTQAVNNGAVAIVVDEWQDTKVTQIKVENVRKCISLICSNFFDNPDKKLKIIGISGTNGKTTSSYMLKNILKTAGKKVGLIGTNNVEIGEIFYKATLTTPDPQELFEIFSKMVKADIEYVIMEVSAHALDLYKVWGIKFEVGLFTNFTQDHLDYFLTMENYKKAKQKFFNQSYCKKCVFNIDDKTGKEFFDICNCNKYTYGLMNPSDIFAVDIEMTLAGSKFVVNIMDEILNIELPLAGKFNVYNAMGIILTAKALNISSEFIVAGLYTLPPIDGRFNLIKVGTKNVIIDFAHTPDGMENVLRTARALSKGKITTIFGCGGNRDSLKRSQMGLIASKYSSHIILTSDNPRFEEPMAIINDIKVGCPQGVVIENRREAIIYGIEGSEEGCSILILGKGAEDYQEINGIKHPFSDYKVVQEIINKKRYNIKE